MARLVQQPRPLQPRLLSRTLIGAANFGKYLALRNYSLFLRASATPPGLVASLSPHAALQAAEQASRRVPAYRALLAAAGWRDDSRLPATRRLARLPVTDKANYIKVFSTEERCLDGAIPLVGTKIDESSGSSGTPYNWVRSAAELREVQRQMSQFARYLFQTKVITLNGFSMGAWAPGRLG